MEILRIPTHYATQITYMSNEDKAYIFEVIMRMSIWERFELEKSMRWWIALSIFTEAVQLENKAIAKKWKSLKIDIPPMVQPMEQSNFNNEAPKSNQVNTSQIKTNQNNIISKEITKQSFELEKIDNRKEDINEMQEIIKDKVLSLWLIYKSWKQERNRIQNILTWKDFWLICEKANMSRIDFVLNIIELSTKLEFWKWKIYNAETLYKHYASVYNEAVRIKTEKEIKKGWVWRV